MTPSTSDAAIVAGQGGTVEDRYRPSPCPSRLGARRWRASSRLVMAATFSSSSGATVGGSPDTVVFGGSAMSSSVGGSTPASRWRRCWVASVEWARVGRVMISARRSAGSVVPVRSRMRAWFASTSGHGHVGVVPAAGRLQHGDADVDGVALVAVSGHGPAELDVRVHVVGGEGHGSSLVVGRHDGSAGVDSLDGPGVPVPDSLTAIGPQAGVVAAGGDPIAGPRRGPVVQHHPGAARPAGEVLDLLVDRCGGLGGVGGDRDGPARCGVVLVPRATWPATSAGWAVCSRR